MGLAQSYWPPNLDYWIRLTRLTRLVFFLTLTICGSLATDSWCGAHCSWRLGNLCHWTNRHEVATAIRLQWMLYIGRSMEWCCKSGVMNTRHDQCEPFYLASSGDRLKTVTTHLGNMSSQPLDPSQWPDPQIQAIGAIGESTWLRVLMWDWYHWRLLQHILKFGKAPP